MKKLLIILCITFVGCSITRTNRKVINTNLGMISPDSTKLWINNTDAGRQLYDIWKSGVYGNNVQVYLITPN